MESAARDRYSHDAMLVARAQAGDRAAFRELFEAYMPLVYRIACRMLGDEHAAEDLTQEVFVRAWQKLGALRDGKAFQAWITRLAVNMHHDRARRRKPPAVSLDAPSPESGEAPQLADTRPGSAEQVLAAELSAHLQAALLHLSPDHRAALVLHHMEGLPLDEIARITGVPVGTVKSRLARGRAELRRHLEGYLEA